MEFRKMVTMTLYARQQKRHRYKEQTFGLCGKRRGWGDLIEQHWNMHITIWEIDHKSKFDAWNWALRARALGNPEGGVGREAGGLQDGGHMYMHGWVTSMYGRNHHNIVKQLASNLNTLINLIKNKMHSEKKKKTADSINCLLFL